ncbi:hypothetical protein [Streptomyces sp. Je 1-369]|uniref:hypothetical protein n=1 Tax=Streptomyces sp. Je 1-369 TaxID=2966192 RepID=UPI002285F746|nr:hypothetical protein [Streptomyces sp. Je 1-369]WAL98769.1 hypothetical protein NOO62_32415 [Streptomyces sp. Je 1-369]
MRDTDGAERVISQFISTDHLMRDLNTAVPFTVTVPRAATVVCKMTNGEVAPQITLSGLSSGEPPVEDPHGGWSVGQGSTGFKVMGRLPSPVTLTVTMPIS